MKFSLFKAGKKNTYITHFWPKVIILAVLSLAIFYGGYTNLIRYTFISPSLSTPSQPARVLPQNNSIVEDRQYWQQQLAEYSSQEVYQQLKDRYQQSDYDTQHLAAHLFGELLFDKEGVEGIKVCDEAFAYGCFHSFIAQAFIKQGYPVLTPISQACLGHSNARVQCEHGIGHGILEYFGHTKLNEALSVCAQIQDKAVLGYFGCTSGVFMEYNVPLEIEGDRVTTSFRALKSDAPFDPCPNVEDRFKDSCYHELPQLWNQTFDHDFTKMGTLCSQISEPNYEIACFNGIGNVSAPSVNFDAAKAIAVCATMPNTQAQEICSMASFWTFINQPNYKDQAAIICQSLPERVQASCRDVKK